MLSFGSTAISDLDLGDEDLRVPSNMLALAATMRTRHAIERIILHRCRLTSQGAALVVAAINEGLLPNLKVQRPLPPPCCLPDCISTSLDCESCLTWLPHIAARARRIGAEPGRRQRDQRRHEGRSRVGVRPALRDALEARLAARDAGPAAPPSPLVRHGRRAHSDGLLTGAGEECTRNRAAAQYGGVGHRATALR